MPCADAGGGGGNGNGKTSEWLTVSLKDKQVQRITREHHSSYNNFHESLFKLLLCRHSFPMGHCTVI